MPMARLAAVNRGSRRSALCSIGRPAAAPSARSRRGAPRLDGDPVNGADVGPAPGGRLDDRPHEGGDPDGGRAAPARSSRARPDSRELGTRDASADERRGPPPDVHPEHGAPREVLNRNPPVTGPRATPTPATAAHSAIALARSEGPGRRW